MRVLAGKMEEGATSQRCLRLTSTCVQSAMSLHTHELRLMAYNRQQLARRLHAGNLNDKPSCCRLFTRYALNNHPHA